MKVEELEKKENMDSLEIGTPRTGKLKVYGDFMKKEEFKKKVDNAYAVLNHANLKIQT